jgi:hypothetical protein
MSGNRKVVSTGDRLTLLTSNEEITLRRVAFGESPVRSMCAQDLMQLRRLRLIDVGKDGPTLTVSGRRHFDSLPRAATLAGSGPRDLLKEMMLILRKGTRR